MSCGQIIVLFDLLHTLFVVVWIDCKAVNPFFVIKTCCENTKHCGDYVYFVLFVLCFAS